MSEHEGDSVLRCHNLQRRFHQGPATIEVLRGVDLTIQRGDRLAIIGASGSGKSTLLQLLGGLDRPDQGEVWLGETQLSHLGEAARGRLRNRQLGFVYQFHHLLPEFNALENVALPLLIGGVGRRSARQRAASMLAQVGLAARQHHKPGALSGGERQRAALARALVTTPRCLLADEPTGNLDRTTAAQIGDLLLQLNRDLAVALVVVTHDPELASRLGQRVELIDGTLQSPSV